MVSPDGRLAIAFNGEIYNHRELRRRLQREARVRFATRSDTEVLLHLYALMGHEFVRVLRGMFALALWDEGEQTLFLARDPLGIKPLYYADDGNTFRAASQVKALLASGRVSRDPDPAGVVGFFLWGSVPEPYTFHREIRLLPAGTTLAVSRDGVHGPVPYFSLAGRVCDAERETWGIPRGEALRRLDSAVRESVQAHLVADVPVGAFLSAGTDSNAVVGLAAGLLHGPMKTVTLAFDEFRGTVEDEAREAETMARIWGTEHVTVRITRETFESEIPRLLDAMDQPSIDGVNIYFVSKAAAETGLKVALSGLGGDELFGGYPSFRQVPRLVRWVRLPGRVPGLERLWRRSLSSWYARFGGKPKAAGLLRYGGSFAGAYFLRRGLFAPWELPALLDGDLIREGLPHVLPVRHLEALLTPRPRTAFGRVAVLEMSQYMRNQLLRDTDWASMAHGLEVRVPFVDAVLLGEAAGLMANALAREGKAALVKSLGLPQLADRAKRPKTGFGIPVWEWIVQSADLDLWRRVPALRRPGVHGSRRWAYAVYALAGTVY